MIKPDPTLQSPRRAIGNPPDTPRQRWIDTAWIGTAWMALVVLAISAVWWSSALPVVLSALLSPLSAVPSAATLHPGDVRRVPAPDSPHEIGGLLVQQACTGGSRDSVNASAVVGQDDWICGDLRVYNGTATIVGRVGGSVTVVHGSVAVSGEVDGNVTVLGGSADLRPGARIGGGISVVGGTLFRADHTAVGGPISTDNTLHQAAITSMLGFDTSFAFPWSHLIFWMAAGATLAFFYPRQLALVHRAVRDELPQSLGLGVVAALTGGIVAVVLTVTCIGIPLAALLLAALWVAWVVGTVAAGSWLGSRMLGTRLPGQNPQLAATVLGVTVLSLAKAIPCIGGVIAFVVGCAGLGASVLALLYARRSTRRQRLSSRREPVPL